MKQQEELKKTQKLSREDINMQIRQYPEHYQTYLKKALEEGDSIEQALESLRAFNL